MNTTGHGDGRGDASGGPAEAGESGSAAGAGDGGVAGTGEELPPVPDLEVDAIEVVLGDILSGSVQKNVAAGRLHAVNVVAEGDVR